MLEQRNIIKRLWHIFRSMVFTNNSTFRSIEMTSSACVVTSLLMLTAAILSWHSLGDQLNLISFINTEDMIVSSTDWYCVLIELQGIGHFFHPWVFASWAWLWAALWRSGLECWLGLATRRSRPGSKPAAATSLWNFGKSVYPALPVSFGGDTTSRRSSLSGVYARGCKISHQSALECTVMDSTTHS